MLIFLEKFSAKNLRKVLVEVFIRMPLSFILTVSTFVLILIRIEVDNTSMSQLVQNSIDKGILSLIVAFFFSVAVYLYLESSQIQKTEALLYQIFTVIFGALFYYFFEENLLAVYH